MERYYKLAFIVFMTLCVSLSIAVSVSLARSKDKPIVIRKKIETQSQEASESTSETEAGGSNKAAAPGPKSDLARLEDNEEIDDEMDEILVAINSTKNPDHFEYNSKGKVDPFEPLFKATTKKEEDITFTPKTPPEGHIPGELEKFDLSQLKLTGIVMSSSKTLGLVQEASGKGYIISKGTRIGTQGGKVSDILKDKVIIKETLENTRGNIVVQKKELKLKNASN